MSKPKTNASPVAGSKQPKPESGRITLTLDPNANEWSLDFTPGLDLLELIQVFNSVQQRALDLLDRQLHPGDSVDGSAADKEVAFQRPIVSPTLPIHPHDPPATASA